MKKSIIILFFVLLIALGLISCSTQASYVDDESDESPLQVYLISWDIFEKDAISKFNSLVSAGEINGRRIEVTEYQYELDEEDEMYNRIASEIMAGKGPDILFIDRHFNQHLDFVNMSRNDAFADLDVLIGNSATFQFEDYNKSALDAGIINDKRVLMPLSYTVDFIITTQDNLDSLGMAVPANLTFTDFFNMIETCHNKTNSAGVNYYVNSLFYDLITPDGLDIEKAGDLKKNIDLLNADDKRIEKLGWAGGMIEDFYHYLCNGEVLMDYSGSIGYGWGEFDLLCSIYNIIENLYGNNLAVMREPSYDSDASSASIDLACAINMNSKHKNDAFTFVEFLLSEQCQYGNLIRANTLPVNSAAYSTAKEDFLNDRFYSIHKTDFEYALTPLPDQIKDSFINLVECAGEYKYIGREQYIMRNILRDSIRNYQDQKITFEQMIEEINNKLRLYYTE